MLNVYHFLEDIIGALVIPQYAIPESSRDHFIISSGQILQSDWKYSGGQFHKREWVAGFICCKVGSLVRNNTVWISVISQAAVWEEALWAGKTPLSMVNVSYAKNKALPFL